MRASLSRLIFALPAGLGAYAHAEDIKLLDTVEIKARVENLVGIADSANQGVITKTQLDARTEYRPAELLETAPGLIVTQHSGEGKAGQYYLRGFNLDHGTDLRTTVDGMLINQRSHAHGQGWTDLNFFIPELAANLRYKKGPYYADEGDFSSAGAVAVDYVDQLPQRFGEIGIGQNGYYRALLAGSPRVHDGNFLYALEFNHNDGPYTQGDNYRKYNGVLRYSAGDTHDRYNITAMAYQATWRATDQIPLRAVASGALGRYDAIDPTDGGDAARYSLSAAWQRTRDNSMTRANAYVVHNSMHLYSNFTYFTDNINGDQFAQPDSRVVYAANLQHTLYAQFAGKETEYNIGAQLQHDGIDNALYNTIARNVRSTVRTDRILESSMALYASSSVRWLDKFRSIVGLRSDVYRFGVQSDDPKNSGVRYAGIVSPKFAAIFGPWSATEFYFNAGNGYHSNDARGVTRSIDPATKITPLVRSWGYEAGGRTALLPGLQSTLSFYSIDFDSELIFAGDAGTTEAGRASRRLGFEFANAYAPTRWLTLDADIAYAHARFRDYAAVGNYIPGAVEGVATLAMSIDRLGDIFGGLQWRYFGTRPLIEDNSVRSNATSVFNLHAGYRFNTSWSAAAEIYNLFNGAANAIDYYYASQLKTESVPQSDLHFHPMEPRTIRVTLNATF